MIAAAVILAITPVTQDRVPEISLGARVAAISEPFSAAMGLAELPDGRVIVSDRVEQVFSLADFATGQRRTIGRNGTGPNEYLTPFGPTRWRGDTLLGYDPNNRRYLRITPEGAIAGAIAFPDTRGSGVTGWATPRGVDPQGRVYWDMPIIDMQPVVKRSMKARLVRWLPGTGTPEVALEFSDHGQFEHEFRFRPMPQTDAWVVGSDGRIGVISAAEYRLRWYRDGAVVETGPPIPFTPTRLTAAERDAFRAQKLLEPAAGGSMNGARPSANRPSLEQVKATWPDSIFPAAMPPFEINGALVSPSGEIWVRRTGPASAPSARVDILDPRGHLKATLRLPARTRLFALGARGVYLLRTDDDGFQALERYPYPGAGR